jgi:amino acid permease
LVKNAVAAGVFSLSSKAMSIDPTGAAMGRASGLIGAMALWSVHNFKLVAATCEMTDTRTYEDAWAQSVGKNTAWIIKWVLFVAPLTSCLSSSIVLVDIFKSLLTAIGAPAILIASRPLLITLLSGIVLFPLCTLKNLDALANVSIFGIIGQLLAMCTLAARALDKSYLPGGQFYTAALAAADAAAKAAPVVVKTTITEAAKPWFIMASMLSYCLVCHYNAPKYYFELRDKSLERIQKMAALGYAGAFSLYATTMYLGVWLFGSKSKSFVLNNFAANDPLALTARLAFGASVLGR